MFNNIDLNNLIIKFSTIKDSENVWNPQGIKGCNIENFTQNNKNVNKSIFSTLDFNKDGNISEFEYSIAKGCAGEDGILTNKELNASCLKEMKYFARREIDKWFKIDKNRDGEASNIESMFWDKFNTNGKNMDGPLSNQELSTKYNLKEEKSDIIDFESWMNGIEKDLVTIAKNNYGVELTQNQIIELKKEAIKQLNTWLFKTEDNSNAPFYTQLNLDAYTRLMSTEDGVACCGGDICEIPAFSPSNLEKNGKYTAEEIKARLNWAENSYEVDESGNTIHDKNGNTIPTKIMTQKQIQMYKDIVESVTGRPWDSNDWEINCEDWYIIGEKINGTYGDKERLKNKTRADIPENRYKLLKFLEQKGLLLDQFKE